MINSLSLENFTLFRNAQFKFARGLNVFVGENGSGKTHLLKILFSTNRVMLKGGKKDHKPADPTKGYLEKEIANGLKDVFRPDKLGRLCSRTRGRMSSTVSAKWNGTTSLSFSFSTEKESSVLLDKTPSQWQHHDATYMPSHEMMTLFPDFASIYDSTELEFNYTLRDLAGKLGAPGKKGPPPPEIKSIIDSLHEILGGEVILENKHFYVKSINLGKLEVSLLSEGLCKIAQLLHLVKNRTLSKGDLLLWDEPESNLNPQFIKTIATILLQLSTLGIQVFVATHSLFLLRALSLESTNFHKTPVTYFGLQLEKLESGGIQANVQSGPTVDHLGPFAAHRAQLEQETLLFQAYSKRKGD